MSDRVLDYAKRKLDEELEKLRAQTGDQLLPYEKYAVKVGEIAGLKRASDTLAKIIDDYRNDRLVLR